MIDKNDWALRFTDPGILSLEWEPDAALKQAASDEQEPVKIVAKELARVQGEKNRLAWYWYIGLAITWLMDVDDVGWHTAAKQAADPQYTCPARRQDNA